MAFQSILSRNAKDSTKTFSMKAPTFFGDLNLDQVVDAITAGKQEYGLKPFFYTPLGEFDGHLLPAGSDAGYGRPQTDGGH
jgi:DNA mismatch repair protein MutS